MPFGLRLKKTRRYNVSSKNSFVAKIQLLDGTLMECTLTNESLGQDCLDTIAQRLQLEEIIYFGLQYMNKNYKTRWVDLEKPLKKQLDKNAHDPEMRFGVMLYVSDITKLRQEITRYLYFLQLKSDIIEVILPCTPEQAVLLASFAVQAEFGDYDVETHTIDFLQNFVLLPKNLTSHDRADILGEYMQEVVNAYKSHRGMSPDNAELAYILDASQLDGYGQETYPSKDDKNNEILLGASSIGVYVKHLNGQATKYYKWSEIENIIHNKRHVGLEFAKNEVQFQMEDGDTAKYVWRMCRTQWQFYRENLEDTMAAGVTEVILRPGGQERLIDGPGYENNILHDTSNGPYRPTIERRPTLLRHSELSEQLNKPRGELSSDESLHQNVQVNGKFNQSQLSLEQHPTQDMIGQYTNSQLSLDRAAAMEHRPIYANGNIVNINGSVYSAPSVNSLNHGIHAQVSPTSSNPSLTGNELIRAKLQAALPAYRQTPDYEALIQGHRLMTVGEQSRSMSNLGQGHGTYGQIDGYVYAQPQLRQHNYTPHETRQRHQHRVSYGGMPTNYMGNFHDTSVESLPYMGQMNYHSNQMVHTYSVPELTSEQIQTMDYIAEKLRKNKTKPPPPYPRGSTSTPDLARQSLQNHLVSSSSPDLVSQRMRNLIHPVPEVLGSAGSNMVSSFSSSSGNFSQSIPLESFQNMRISDLPQNGQVGMRYPVQMQAHLADLGHSDIPILQAPVGYDEGGVILRDRAYSVGSKPMRDYHVPLVRPPSEFADTSDIDSNISPNSVGSPPRQFRLPGQDMYISTQASVPENAMITYAANYGPVQHSPPNPKYAYKVQLPQHSAPSSPEMRELNVNQYALMHLDQVGIRQQPFQIPQANSEPILTTLPNHTPPDNRPKTVNPHSTFTDLHLTSQNESYNSDSVSVPGSSAAASPQSPEQASGSGGHRHPEQLAKRISSGYSTSPDSDQDVKGEGESKNDKKEDKKDEFIGPLKLAAMSGLTLMRPGHEEEHEDDNPKHPRDARRKVLDQQLKEGQVFTEYQHIYKKRPDAIYYTAQLRENVPRNRFPDVLPYEDTRIELTTIHDKKTGYINASFIQVPIARELFQYVAAQAPLEATVIDWWRMVWEKDIHVIAMLTKLEEGGKEKCFRYWPECNSKKNTVEFGPFRVIGQFCNDSGNYITSGLTVRHIPSGEQRTVWHLQYNDWPNQGCPDDVQGYLGVNPGWWSRKPSGEQRTVWHLQYNDWPNQGCPDDVQGYLAFIEEFQSVWRHANSMNEDDKPSPPLIHCSAGVGRTGVLVLTDVMINSLEHNEEINIPRMLELLRQQRMLMVQTVGQYMFVYQALIQFLKNTRLI